MPGEEYKGIADYMFTGDDGNTVDGEISYTAEVVGSDGDIDNNGAGGFYGLKVIPDSLEAHFDELGAENSLAKLDDDFANEQIKPGGDEHEEALRIAQEDADEMFSQADIDVPMESNELTEAPIPDFQYLSTMPVADNFLRFVVDTNKAREEEQRMSGGYGVPSLEPITDEMQLQRVWEHFTDEFNSVMQQDKQEKFWAKIKDNAKNLLNDNTFLGVPPEYKITDDERFIVNFLYNRGFAHTKQMLQRVDDFIKENDPKLKKYNSIESLPLFDNQNESIDMNEELNSLKKLAGLEVREDEENDFEYENDLAMEFVRLPLASMSKEEIGSEMSDIFNTLYAMGMGDEPQTDAGNAMEDLISSVEDYGEYVNDDWKYPSTSDGEISDNDVQTIIKHQQTVKDVIGNASLDQDPKAPELFNSKQNEELNDIRKRAGLEEACGGCQEEEQSDKESVHFRKEKSSDTGSVSIEASADSMEEMKRLLALIGHDLPKEMSPHSDGEVDNGPDGEVMAEPVAITVTQPEQGEKPFDPYGNNKKALLNYLRDSYKSQ